MTRIAILGNSGAGKTTLAQTLSRALGLPHIELDALHWQAEWTPEHPETLRKKVKDVTSKESWILDGNYSAVRPLVLERANLVVWLDLPLPLILGRLAQRTLRRAIRAEPLWNGNRENLGTVLFSKDSLFLWALRTHGPRTKEYAALFADPGVGPKLIRLCHPREVTKWTEQLIAASRPTHSDSAPNSTT